MNNVVATPPRRLAQALHPHGHRGERLAADPRCGERLSGLRECESGRQLCALRVGDHRVICAFSDREAWVLVVRVGPRGGGEREL